jgi:hypothetical protein
MRETLTRRQQQLIAAMLQHTSLAKAAAAAHVPESTAHRWLTQPEFVVELRHARRKLTERATTNLQAGAPLCAAKLIQLALDAEMPPTIQLAAASRVLELAFRGEELQDIQERIAALETRLGEGHQPPRKGLKLA